MRKIIVFIILLLFTFTGCDPYAGKRPEDYPNTRWICKEPYVRIDISDEDGINNVVFIDYNGEITKMVMLFLPGSRVEFYRFDDYEEAINDSEITLNMDVMMVYGDCKFGKRKFVVEIDESQFFDESVKVLVFYRE